MKQLSAEQGALLLTRLNDVITLAITKEDRELAAGARRLFNKVDDEWFLQGYRKVWHVDSQSYTLVPTESREESK